MSSTLRGRGNASPFFDPSDEHPFTANGKSRARVAHAPLTGKAKLLPGIINGERVLVAELPKEEPERAIEIRVRVALAAAGVLVWKHAVERCPHCGAKPRKGSGLGHGTSDLIAVVPPYGRFLGIEMKRRRTRSRTSCAQKCWLDVVRRFGGVSGVATSVEEAMALVALARQLP